MDRYNNQTIFTPLVFEPFITCDSSLEFKKSYREWFLKYRWNRLWQLFNLIHSFDDFHSWNNNFTVNSLYSLSDFLSRNIEYRHVSEEDFINEGLPYHFEYWTGENHSVVTNRTLSIFFDAGIYIGEIFAMLYGMNWELYKPKNFRWFNSGSMVLFCIDEVHGFVHEINPIPRVFSDFRYDYKHNIPYSLVKSYMDIEYYKTGGKQIESAIDNEDLPDTFFHDRADYRIIKIFNPDNPIMFKDYGKRIKRKFGEWFESHIECRYYQLKKFIISSGKYKDWKGGFAVDSLYLLDDLLSDYFGQDKNGKEMSELQYSLVFDIAMYFGTTFILNTGLHWEQFDLSSKMPDSGMMVIPICHGPLSDRNNYFNPFEIIYNIASGKEEMKLNDVFRYYKSRINYEGMNLMGNQPKAIKTDINDFAWMRKGNI